MSMCFSDTTCTGSLREKIRRSFHCRPFLITPLWFVEAKKIQLEISEQELFVRPWGPVCSGCGSGSHSHSDNGFDCCLVYQIQNVPWHETCEGLDQDQDRPGSAATKNTFPSRHRSISSNPSFCISLFVVTYRQYLKREGGGLKHHNTIVAPKNHLLATKYLFRAVRKQQNVLTYHCFGRDCPCTFIQRFR